MRERSVAWLLGLTAMWLVGCNKPCESTSQCGNNEMCAASVCEALSCEKTIFAIDPATGSCTPVSGCFLTPEQLGWKSCSDDPCLGQDETSCLRDRRCQPAYTNPDVAPPKVSLRGATNDVPQISCAGGGPPELTPDLGQPNGFAPAPGVNNGQAPKHPDPSGSCGAPSSARAFAGCRAVPTVTPLDACEQLKSASCLGRRDCTTDASQSQGGGTAPTPVFDNAGSDGKAEVPFRPSTNECFTLHPQPSSDCSGVASSCLLNPACQPIGTRCYCPPGGRCDCSDGAFLGCESNDRLRRCHSSSDCDSSERCDNDEACIAPRTFTTPGSGSSAVPGTASCVGACVPKGCAGLGEAMCNADPSCSGGSYGTVCRPKPYCAGGGRIIEDPRADSSGSTGPGGNSCGCDSEFTGCAPLQPVSELRVERSLLVRDPEIIDDPGFRLDQVLAKLAPSGKVDEFSASLLKQIGGAATLGNGAAAKARTGYASLLKDLSPDTAGITSRLASLLHITALVNRIDLAKPGSCGEARLTYALTRAYDDGNQRMTMIIELHVPDDGHGCRSVAQRWAELSLVDSSDERKRRLLTLYSELLTPATLGQIRTNEFLNRTGQEPWELREFHLDGSGLPVQVAVAQTVDKRLTSDAGLLAWVRSNSAALIAGNATIPTQYLAAASTEDGGRIELADRDGSLKDATKAINAQACAGCHLTETQSPFVHIGERLGKRVAGMSGFQPIGRAVIDSFLEKELVTRAKNLHQLLTATPQTLRPAPQQNLARIH